MAVAQSLNQLRRQEKGSIESGSSYRVDVDLIQEEDGFNVRDYEAAEEHIESIKKAYQSGAFVPPLIVQVKDNRIILRDGHCRIRAARRAREEGTELKRLEVIEFTGDELDQTMLLLSSNSGKPLDTLARAKVYQRLSRMGLSNKEVAERVNTSVVHVSQALTMLEMPEKLKDQIRDELVSPTLALDLYREHGSEAVDVVDEAAKEASSVAGDKKKPKLTGRNFRKKRNLPKDIVNSLRTSVGSIASVLEGVEVKDDSETVNLSLTREQFLQLREDALKVRERDIKDEELAARKLAKARKEAEKNGETLPEDEEEAAATPAAATAATVATAAVAAEVEEATEAVEAQQEEAEPVAAQAEEETQQEEIAEPASTYESDVVTAGSLDSQPDVDLNELDELEALNQEEPQGNDMVEELDGLSEFMSQDEAPAEEAQQEEEFEELYTVVPLEEEESMGMHNTPDDY